MPSSPPELERAFAAGRPDLLRHCYRMLGVFADAEDAVQDVFVRALQSWSTFAGESAVSHWLMRIATNVCLNRLARDRPRGLPQLDRPPAEVGSPLVELDAATWITPAPDGRLQRGPAQALEDRESVALAFVALLQRLPPKQRAVLLLKDVVGWSAEEIATALELSVPAVSSALHRARESVAARAEVPDSAPPPEVLRDYLRSWEQRDLDGLVALMKKDVVFAMPPHQAWFQGAEAMRRFLQTPRFSAFWARGLTAIPTRANGLPAAVWLVPDDRGGKRQHSLHVMRFEGGLLAEAVNFIGPSYLHGFEDATEARSG